MKRLLLIIFLSTPAICFSQKMYVWCPENNQIKQRVGLKTNDTINVVFFDGRSIPNKNKIECTFEQLSQTLFSQLKTAYPGLNLVLRPESDYYIKSITSNNKLIKIAVGSYHAGFGTDISGGIGMVGGSLSTMIIPKGQWNAITSFHIQVISSGASTAKDIANLSSKSNMLGYKSARNALNECYNKSIGELLFYLDEQILN